MPVRTIPKSRRSITGRVASQKLARAAEFESALERDLLTLLEFAPDVLSFEEQPVRIPFTLPDGSEHTYTPDVLVTYRGSLARREPKRIELIEVKYRADLFAQWAELKPKLKAGRAYARERGWRFVILTEREIRTPYLQNVRFLLGYRSLRPDPREVALLTRAVSRRPGLHPEQLFDAVTGDRWRRAELIPTLWHLVATGAIEVDLSVPLTMHSPLRLRPKEDVR